MTKETFIIKPELRANFITEEMLTGKTSLDDVLIIDIDDENCFRLCESDLIDFIDYFQNSERYVWLGKKTEEMVNSHGISWIDQPL